MGLRPLTHSIRKGRQETPFFQRTSTSRQSDIRMIRSATRMKSATRNDEAPLCPRLCRCSRKSLFTFSPRSRNGLWLAPLEPPVSSPACHPTSTSQHSMRSLRYVCRPAGHTHCGQFPTTDGETGPSNQPRRLEFDHNLLPGHPGYLPAHMGFLLRRVRASAHLHLFLFALHLGQHCPQLLAQLSSSFDLSWSAVSGQCLDR